MAWLVRTYLIWGDDTAPTGGLPDLLLRSGTVVLVVALAAGGYALVATAPVWLRGVVSVATVLLILMLWQLVTEALDSDWMTALAGGASAVLLGLYGFGRSRPDPPEEPVVRGGRRAAR